MRLSSLMMNSTGKGRLSRLFISGVMIFGRRIGPGRHCLVRWPYRCKPVWSGDHIGVSLFGQVTIQV